MKAAGVPCVPGSDGVIVDFEQCEKLAKETGYPVMLKASAGGGGKGMRAVYKPENLKMLTKDHYKPDKEEEQRILVIC